MARTALRFQFLPHGLAASLAVWLFVTATQDASAQSAGPGASTATAPATAKAKPGGANRKSANRAGQAVQKAAQPRKEPSQAYRDSIRQTVEKRRQRRARSAQGFGAARPVGAVIPWLLPPALIIRHTPEVHEEIERLLGLLRH